MPRAGNMAGKTTKGARGFSGLPILWTALFFDLWQFLLALIGILAAALTEIPFFVGSIISTLGGDEAAVFFFLLSFMWGWLGFMVCGLWLTLRGTKLLSGEQGNKKWLVLLACWVIESLPAVNLVPALSYWVWYVLRHPE